MWLPLGRLRLMLLHTNIHTHRLSRRFVESQSLLQRLESCFVSGPDEDWTKIKQQLFSKSEVLNSSRQDHTLMETLVEAHKTKQLQRLDLLRSFCNYLKSKNDLKSNPVLCAQYVSVASLIEDPSSTSELEDLVDYLIESKVQTKYPVFATALTSYAAISSDSCIKVLTYLKQSNSMPPQEVIKHALDHKCLTEAGHFLVATDVPFNNDTLESWLNTLIELSAPDKFVKDLLTHLKLSRTVIPIQLEKRVTRIMKIAGFSRQYTRMRSDSSECFTCNARLATVTESEVNQLRIAVQSHLVKKYLHEKRLKQQLHRLITVITEFDNLFNKHKENYFDLVVDILNLGFSFKKINYKTEKGLLVPYQDEKDADKHAVRTLEANNVAKQFKKVLLVGRAHVKNKWSKLQNYVNQYPDQFYSFYIDDWSSDDPLLLYAAMQSHKTLFVGKDLLRDHQVPLGDKTNQVLFQKWRECRQIQLNQRYRFLFPQNVEHCVNLNESSIHFPFVVNPNSPYPYIVWICYRRSNR